MEPKYVKDKHRFPTTALTLGQVYISARSADVCNQTAKELTEMGPGKCISLPANMQNLSDIDKLVAELTSREKGELCLKLGLNRILLTDVFL